VITLLSEQNLFDSNFPGAAYTHPEWEILFANYGLTAHAAQVLEKMLLLLLGCVHCRDKGEYVPGDLTAFLAKHKRMLVTVQVLKT
jgi:hypothetical protein